MPIGAGSLSEDRSAKAVKKLNILRKKSKNSHPFHFIFQNYNLINTCKTASG